MLITLQSFIHTHTHFVQPKTRETMFVDIGAYGVPAAAVRPPSPKPCPLPRAAESVQNNLAPPQCPQRRGEFDAEGSGRGVEAFVAARRGFQMLYADSYRSRDELNISPLPNNLIWHLPNLAPS